MVGNGRPADEENSGETAPAGATAGQMVESVVGCKWSLAVLAALRAGVHRPGELERRCAGISNKVLHERLRKLERFGVVERRVFPTTPPKVEYHFTGLGERFLGVIDAVDALQATLDAPD